VHSADEEVQRLPVQASKFPKFDNILPVLPILHRADERLRSIGLTGSAQEFGREGD
jgi:hypothetical protein